MKTKICSIFGLLAFVIAPLFSGAEEINLPRPDPAVAEFARGVKFTVAGYQGGEEVQTNFPVLVRLSTAISGFKYSDFYADGSDLSLIDIGFVDAEGHGLAYDIDTWNPLGESLVWVNLPRMTNGTEFAMWYRSSKTGKVLNSDNVWADYTGVWHLNESGNGNIMVNGETVPVNTPIMDSSTNALDGAAQGLAASVAAGKIGGSWRISNDYARKDASILIDLVEDPAKNAKVDALDDTFCASFWTKRRDKEVKWCVAGLNRRQDGSTAGWGAQVHDDATQLRIYGNGGKNTYAFTEKMSGFNTANQWDKIDIIWYNADGQGKMIVYRNGANKVGGKTLNPTTPVDQPSGQPLVMGNFNSPTSDRAWSGELDEVRLIKGIPSAARVQADYDTVNSAMFLSAASVVTNDKFTERPVANLQVVDVGASHVQFGGALLSLGSTEASSCVFSGKVWTTAGNEPDEWTEFASGLTGGALSGLVKGLTPATAYSYKLKVTNNADVGSDDVEGSFTTSGVGVGGTGGDVTRIGDDWIHYFRVGLDEEGAITNTYVFTPPSYATTVRALVVAGGGPGGYYAGGGGGAGGYYYNETLGVTSGAAYTINVGTGGVAATSATVYGSNGGNSSIVGGNVNVVMQGGGAGGNGKLKNQTATLAGKSGGSGGGTAWTGYSTGSGAEGQGNDGGDVPSGQYQQNLGAGGGGAAAVGGSIEYSDKEATKGSGVGGNGRSCDITGQKLYYAGGGGGGAKQVKNSNGIGVAGKGGNGGGGKGGQYDETSRSQYAAAGKDGLGGGGGGGSNYSQDSYQGGDGGDGIVIIRYASQGDPSTVPEPIISLKSAVCNDAKFTGDVTFRVAWAGYNSAEGKAYETANVKIKWGYSRNNLVHTTDVLVSNVVGIASASFDLIADECTVYCRAVAVNGADIEGESTETLSFYVNDNENARVDETTPILTAVGLSRVDALYAVVTGMVVSTGVSSAEPKTCKVRVKIGSTENNLVVTNEMSAPVGPFSLGIDGLNEQTTYYYCVEALDDNETTVDTDPESFTTIPAASVLGALTTSTSLTNYTISGSLSVVGAGTTHILVKWGEGEWEEIGAFNVLSNDTSFSATYHGTWDDSSITGQLMCSNACERVDGTLAGDPFVTTQNNSFSPVDDATYTWQPVNDDWNGDWNDPAHWASSKVGRGYPDNAHATADFVNCTTANPVTVNVNGKFLTNKTKFYGSAASDITFVGTGTNTSSLASGYAQNEINSNSKVEFRDMAFTMSANWEVLRTDDKTNVTFRLSNVAANCTGYFALSAPFCRAEFVDGTFFSAASKFNMGGTNTVCLIDDSTVTAHTMAIMNGDCNVNGNLQYVFKGTAPKFRLLTDFYPYKASPNVSFTFFVPVGGYAEPPIQLTHASKKFLDSNNACDAHFYVAEDSPALVKSSQSLENVVIVDTKAGLKTENIVGGIGVVPEHGGVSCGEFKYGAGGEPLADGAAPSTARQIMLDLKGYDKSNGIIFLIY